MSSSSTTPVMVKAPLPAAAGIAVTSISSSVPRLGPYTASPLTKPTLGSAGTLRSGRGGIWLLFTTHSTSAGVTSLRLSVMASPAAS
ncbi:hypothetical protein D3C75_1090900 [compost metagenome]